MCHTATAQDLLTTTKGDTIKASVKSASIFRVRYRLEGDKDSIVHTLPASAVYSIVYTDGRVFRPNPNTSSRPVELRKLERTSQPRDRTPTWYQSYNNVLTANVPNLIFVSNFFGVAWGAQYERYFGKKGHFSIDIPYYFSSTCFDHAGENHPGTPYQKARVNYVAPGLHFHPFGNNHGADLSFGLNYGIGNIKLYSLMLEQNGYKTDTLNAENVPLSFGAITVNLNLHTTSQFVCGIFVQYGHNFAPNRKDATFFQLGLKLGARF